VIPFFGRRRSPGAVRAEDQPTRARVVNASTRDPRDVPLDFTPGLAPLTAADAIARQVRRLNAHDAARDAAAETGRWFRACGPRKNAHGLYAPGDAR
jgi:hypothetical protein